MKRANATNLYRKSGGAQWRDLRFHLRAQANGSSANRRRAPFFRQRKPQVPPLRRAPVGMTKLRTVAYLGIGGEGWTESKKLFSARRANSAVQKPAAPFISTTLELVLVNVSVEGARLHRVRVLHLNEDAIPARRGETVREFNYWWDVFCCGRSSHVHAGHRAAVCHLIGSAIGEVMACMAAEPSGCVWANTVPSVFTNAACPAMPR